MTMQVLSENEIREVSGGLGPVGALSGGIGGLAMYAGSHYFFNQPMTWQGAAWAAGTGAAIGATGGALMAASGGGLAANLAWRPGMMSANFGLGQYSNHKDW
ncbi:hypothetical protein [Burkholderia guangdongensis]|uniref:hypothetical protein n=1 Tax=Burkholderia guangdongensis TaxID=1792500 RepID=UPI0015CA449E|nr:hypothetical protein [Burkholderia guangdongensis]